ncbi:MAG TPA: zinc-dependent alcohol dehydrogenase family protein [Methylomirabilota bacterium]|nr:zinc-dependent alcohol dehydrogenase family protein [Methylomirabilota bacterium]
MKAAVMMQFREPLEIQELPDPTPGPTDAVVRVESCGICRTDWHVWQGDWAWIGLNVKFPHVMGHEFGGVVEAVGSDVQGVKPGERVTVPFHLACGRCEYCYSGRSNICNAHGVIGVHSHGGFGRLVLVPAAGINLVRLPDEVDFLSAAAIGCRYMTAYHALVDRANIRPGEWVAVFGIGGVGLSAVQIATVLGAQVVAIDIGESKLAMARKEGAAATVNAAQEDPVAAVKAVTNGGAGVTVDALGSAQTALPALRSLRKAGRHIQIGLTSQAEKGKLSVPADVMTLQEMSFIGSVGCPTTSYPGLLALIATGKLDPKRLVTDTIPIEQASDVLSSMTNFATVGFNVITAW